MIWILGPTAAGKTTLSRTLCRRLRSRKGCLFTVAEPFGGAAYVILYLLTLLNRLMYRHARYLLSRRALAQIEIARPRFLGKILSLIILLDFLSGMARYLLLSAAEKAGFTVLIEDGLPQALIDHVTYVAFYAPHSVAARTLLRIEYKAIYKLLSSRSSKCIIVYTSYSERAGRARKRGGSSVETAGFYNDIVRLKLPLILCNAIKTAKNGVHIIGTDRHGKTDCIHIDSS